MYAAPRTKDTGDKRAELNVTSAQELKAARSDTNHVKSKMDLAKSPTANHETKIQVSRLLDHPATLT